MERFILLARLIGIALLVAACASAQTPEPNRIEDLATFHDGDTGNAVLCWETDGNWRSPGACSCPVGEEFDPVEGCRFPPSTPICGDGEINQVGEDCDGGDLGGQTCQTQGFDSGTLACFPAGHAQECTFDTSSCVNNPPPPTGVWDLVAANLPSPGEFAQLPNTAIGAVLVQNNEFSYGDEFGDFKAQNAFMAWVGMAFDEAEGKWWNFGGGGHADYGGNEGYQFDFSTLTWSRLWDPTEIDGPFLSPDCQVHGQFPYSLHTYDGALFVPSTNEVIVAGGNPWAFNRTTGIAGGCTLGTDGGLYAYSLGTQTWREIEAYATTMTRFPSTAYDAARDKVYFFGHGVLRELDPQNNYAVTLIGNNQRGWTDSVARFDESTRFLYFTDTNSFSGGRLMRRSVSLAGVFGPLETVVSNIASMNFANALAIHPSGLILWDGRNGVFRVDPETGAIEDLSTPGPPAPSTGTTKIFSKWVYVEAIDAFIALRDARDGVWIYRLPEAAPEPPPAASNFEERCNAEGVVFCDPLDTEGPWGVDASGVRRLMPNPDGSTGIPVETSWRKWRGSYNTQTQIDGAVPPHLDTQVKASGTGSLRVVYPPFSNEGASGNFVTNFSDDLSQTCGEGDTCYVQYRWRANCDFIYTDCDPNSPDYKSSRRSYAGINNARSMAKLSIIADGDDVLGEPSVGACTWMQVVTVHDFDHALVGFHSCGWYEGFRAYTGENYFGSFLEDLQPNGGTLGVADDSPPTCWTMPNAPNSGAKRGWGFTGPDCFLLDADEWFTVQVKLEIGRWQPNRDGEPDSRIVMWAAREGEPQQVVIDHALYLRGPDFREANTRGEYGKIWLHAFMTAKDPNEDHPTAVVWFDELIVSREFIEDPT